MCVLVSVSKLYTEANHLPDIYFALNPTTRESNCYKFSIGVTIFKDLQTSWNRQILKRFFALPSAYLSNKMMRLCGYAVLIVKIIFKSSSLLIQLMTDVKEQTCVAA